MSASFIGVDLAWQSEGRNSGLAAIEGDQDGGEVVRFGEGASALDAVMGFILANQAETTVVAIDAPLIIQNPEGQRPCETLISRRFGGAHAGAHTTNLKRYPNAASVALGHQLEAQGFRHCSPPGTAWTAAGHWFFEVYPHPAQVVLFQRDRIIKYKKGSIAAKRRGLAELREEIRARILGHGMIRSSPSLVQYLSLDLDSLRGSALKHYEDALDAIVCSFLAYYLWRWGWQRSEFFGDLVSGYIVVPSKPLV